MIDESKEPKSLNSNHQVENTDESVDTAISDTATTQQAKVHVSAQNETLANSQIGTKAEVSYDEKPEKFKKFKQNAVKALDSYSEMFEGQHRRSHILLWTVFAFVIIAIIWAKLAVIDEVTHAEGKVIPSQHIQVIQNLEGGIVREILVREGETVERSQIIMHIDDTRFASSYRESVIQQANLTADVARLKALAEGTEFTLSDEFKSKHPQIAENAQSLYDAQQKEIKSRVASLEDQVKQKQQEILELTSRIKQLSTSTSLVRKELRMTKPLVKDGAVSEVEVLRLEREVNDLSGELNMAKLSKPRAEAALNEVKNRIMEVVSSARSEAHDELNKAKGELAKMNESMTALEDRVVRTAVRSPVKGIVKQVNINTIGGVIQPGMDIIEIVPLDDTLLIEAKMNPKDIGFIRPGEKAMVKFTAYDFSIYGGLKGTVEHISADSITDEREKTYYEIRVRTQKNHLGKDDRKLEIMPGMQAQVDIITGRKSVLDYLLKPLLKTKQNALTER